MSIASKIKSFFRRLFSFKNDSNALLKLIEVQENGDVVLFFNGSKIVFTTEGNIELTAKRFIKIDGCMVFIKPSTNQQQIEEAFDTKGVKGVEEFLKLTAQEQESLHKFYANSLETSR